MKTHSIARNTLLILSTAAIAACSLFARPRTESGWINWDSSEGWSSDSVAYETVESLGAGPMLEESDSAPHTAGDEAPRAETGASQAPNLRAGSVDDNAEWDDYLLYRQQFIQWGIPVHDLDVSERHVITIRDQNGLPVLGASVRIHRPQGGTVAELQTTSSGQVLFFPAVYGLEETETFVIEVEKDGQSTSQEADRTSRAHFVMLTADGEQQAIRIDVHFLIDATGSMSDEILQLKENMIRIAESIQDLNPDMDVRYGMTVYRDRGDAFVSRTLEFTPDVSQFVDELSAVMASGGGDYPESLNEGLHDALHLPEWRSGDCIRLIFLIADAPPHLDYGNDYDYAEEVLYAAEMGIKIFPLASSGLDDQGEYIFRQLAQISGGKFLFLTYGAGGAPGDDTTHHVEDYSVLSLDQLVLRMIEEELDNLSKTVSPW